MACRGWERLEKDSVDVRSLLTSSTMIFTKEMQTHRRRNRRGNVISASKLITDCDEVFSLMVRRRDGMCVRCYSIRTLQAAHIASRDAKSGRWDMLNALTMCFPCHIRWAHRHPLEFVAWVKRKFPEFYERSQRVLATTVHLSIVDLMEIKTELKRQYALETSPAGIVYCTIDPSAGTGQ